MNQVTISEDLFGSGEVGALLRRQFVERCELLLDLVSTTPISPVLMAGAREIASRLGLVIVGVRSEQGMLDVLPAPNMWGMFDSVQYQTEFEILLSVAMNDPQLPRQDRLLLLGDIVLASFRAFIKEARDDPQFEEQVEWLQEQLSCG